MIENQDRLEQLISRRLDGEITAAEDSELEAMIAHSAEAGNLLDAYERQGELVGAALTGGQGARGC